VLHATFTHKSKLYITAVCPQNWGDLLLSHGSPREMWEALHLKDLSELVGP